MSPRETTTLYRMYDADRVLLYVGISNRPHVRFAQHAADKPWWTEVAHIAVEHHPGRGWAAQAERHAIETEQPLYNVIHSPHPDGIEWWDLVEHRPDLEALSVEISYVECYWAEQPWLPCATGIWFGYTDDRGHRLGMKHRLRALVGPDASPDGPSVIRHPSAYNVAARYLLEQLDEAKLHRPDRMCCQ